MSIFAGSLEWRQQQRKQQQISDEHAPLSPQQQQKISDQHAPLVSPPQQQQQQQKSSLSVFTTNGVNHQHLRSL